METNDNSTPLLRTSARRRETLTRQTLALWLVVLISVLLIIPTLTYWSFRSYLSKVPKITPLPEPKPLPDIIEPGKHNESEQSEFLKQLLANREPDNNQQPLIGVLSQPLYHSFANVSFIAASYVQFVESAGARAIPIVYSDPKEEIIRRFKEVSGIILPGGTVGL